MRKIKQQINVSETDIIKSIAVLAVIWQGVLNLAVKQPITLSGSIASTILFNLVKFSATAFIFAICFDLSRIKNQDYKHHISHKAKELLVPYFIWSTVYMLIMSNFSTIGEYIQGYAFGTGAAHLWYTVMMFQFQLLVPVTWFLFKKFSENKKNITITLVTSVVFFLVWLWIYNKYNFNLSENKSVLYTDRLFVSYSIYGILGVIASATYEKWKNLIYIGRYVIITLFLGAFVLVNYEVLNSEFLENVNLHNIIYLKPSMFLYNIAAILLIYLVAITLIKRSSKILPLIKFISTYAFRAYLANSFCLQIVSKLANEMFGDINLGFNILILFLLTTMLSFALVITIEWVSKNVKGMFTERNINRSSTAGV